MSRWSDSMENHTGLSPLKRAYLTLDRLESKLKALEDQKTEPIAIIGMSCRFPGADNPESFWQLLREGVDAITEVPADRWRLEEFYDPDPNASGKTYTRWGGFIDEVDLFDAHFFRISPREAAGMDPQHRLLLQVSYEALENAGQTIGRSRWIRDWRFCRHHDQRLRQPADQVRRSKPD